MLGMEVDREGRRRVKSWKISDAWVRLIEDVTGDTKRRFLFCEKCEENSAFRPCEHALEARRIARESFQKNLKLRRSKVMAKEAVLEIVQRVNRGDYLGEHNPGVVYVGDVVKILDLTNEIVWCVCDELLKEEKLEVQGGALKEYEPRFRFPEEVRHLLSYLAEDHFVEGKDKNGETLLTEMEKAIQESLGHTHCADLFGSGNTPHIKPQTILLFIEGWIDSLIFRAKHCPNEARGMRRSDVENIMTKIQELLPKTF